jgi:hypothetical protein
MKDWYWDEDVYNIDADLADMLELNNDNDLEFLDHDYKYLEYGYTKKYIKENGEDDGI